MENIFREPKKNIFNFLKTELKEFLFLIEEINKSLNNKNSLIKLKNNFSQENFYKKKKNIYWKILNEIRVNFISGPLSKDLKDNFFVIFFTNFLFQLLKYFSNILEILDEDVIAHLNKEDNKKIFQNFKKNIHLFEQIVNLEKDKIKEIEKNYKDNKENLINIINKEEIFFCTENQKNLKIFKKIIIFYENIKFINKEFDSIIGVFGQVFKD